MGGLALSGEWVGTEVRIRVGQEGGRVGSWMTVWNEKRLHKKLN